MNCWHCNTELIWGGDFDYEPTYSVSFTEGDEDLEVEITELVEEWLSYDEATPPGDDRPNYGIGVLASKSGYESWRTSNY